MEDFTPTYKCPEQDNYETINKQLTGKMMTGEIDYSEYKKGLSLNSRVFQLVLEGLVGQLLVDTLPQVYGQDIFMTSEQKNI